MNSKLIIMLTYNDNTVKNAIEVFDECKDLSVECWGFKNIGLSQDKMKLLVGNMKNAGKTTFLEVVTYSEEECLTAAMLAVECEFDYLMGTIFFESVYTYLKNKKIKYMPFCGDVKGNPSVLNGTIESIIKQAKTLGQYKIAGFDLLAYRFTGDADKLAEEFVKQLNLPVVLAGSVQSFERISNVNRYNPWGYTIGSAFFDKKFLSTGSFRENIQKVIEYMNTLK